MTFRELYREQLSLRGIRHRDQIEAEQWADERQPFGASLMDTEVPPKIEPLMRKMFGELVDDAYAPLRERQ
jgi:hypothetical protein